MRNKTAFTLAEFLLTLTILCIVASFAVPALLQSVQEVQFKIAFKQAYNVISQATQKLARNNCGDLTDVFYSSSEVMRDKYLPYLNYTKQCFWNSRGICWSNTFYRLNGIEESIFHYWAPTNLAGNGSGDTSGIVLNNGMFVTFFMQSHKCVMFGGIEGCGGIFVDVNGFKGPNTIGKDINAFYVLKDGSVKPYGYMAPIDSLVQLCIQPPGPNWNTVDNHGYGCALQYLLN